MLLKGLETLNPLNHIPSTLSWFREVLFVILSGQTFGDMDKTPSGSFKNCTRPTDTRTLRTGAIVSRNLEVLRLRLRGHWCCCLGCRAAPTCCHGRCHGRGTPGGIFGFLKIRGPSLTESAVRVCWDKAFIGKRTGHKQLPTLDQGCILKHLLVMRMAYAFVSYSMPAHGTTSGHHAYHFVSSFCCPSG